MGGGTAIVEALARGRLAVGGDLNALAVFIARAKTTMLKAHEAAAVRIWVERVVPNLSYHDCPEDLPDYVCPRRTKNLGLPRARPIKKAVALALRSLDAVPTQNARSFIRCALLNAAQGVLNGAKRSIGFPEFRDRLRRAALQMLAAMDTLKPLTGTSRAILIHDTAQNLAIHEPFKTGALADLVVTSPPYPGIHMLYYRWQVDGRRESAAPYWIADCQDGQGSAFYNFANRRPYGIDAYSIAH